MDTTDDRRELAEAWRVAWAQDDGFGPPSLCEGCSRPAARLDVDGVPLCEGCWDELSDEVPDAQ